MYIEPFLVEEWMNAYEGGAKYNIAETCVESMSLRELCALTGEDETEFMRELADLKLTYGDITGYPPLKEGIASLYRGLKRENVITTHGAAGANHHLFLSLVSPGDKVVSVMPTYQQLYSIPRSLGARVEILKLRKGNAFLPDLNELGRLVGNDTKLICINNPNNPSGALISEETLENIVEIARRAGAYLMADEVYRHLTQDETYSESIADMYEKGISVGSMSKTFSMAGLRLGWLATRDEKAMRGFLTHRDYDHISSGMLDERVAALALKNKEAVFARNRNIVRENLAILDDWIKGEKNFDYVKPSAGTTALVYYNYDIPSYRFARELYEREGVFVTPGDCFGEPRCFRIGYACNKKTLVAGLNGLSAYAENLEIEDNVPL